MTTKDVCEGQEKRLSWSGNDLKSIYHMGLHDAIHWLFSQFHSMTVRDLESEYNGFAVMLVVSGSEYVCFSSFSRLCTNMSLLSFGCTSSKGRADASECQLPSAG